MSRARLKQSKRKSDKESCCRGPTAEVKRFPPNALAKSFVAPLTVFFPFCLYKRPFLDGFVKANVPAWSKT
jgi:hypothetical protein